MYLVKMPNFLSVETRPFDPNFYEGELDEDEILDEEGRTRLKLKVCSLLFNHLVYVRLKILSVGVLVKTKMVIQFMNQMLES